MSVPQLRYLQKALNEKANAIQREFVEASEQLHALERRLIEARGVDEAPILAEQAALRQRQQALALEINTWRDRARDVVRQPGPEALDGYLTELAKLDDEDVRAAVEAARYALDHPEEALERAKTGTLPPTPAGRLLERARAEFDLRGVDLAARRRAAVEFANRPGLAQDDEVLAELEPALADEDPLVSQVALLTVIQIHRFRAMRLSDLDAAHASVRRLARLKHPAVIPVLLEILSTPRTGFTNSQGEMVEGNNLQSRLVALGSLVEFRTSQVQAAIRARQHDRDPRMMEAATRALELFPGEWK